MRRTHDIAQRSIDELEELGDQLATSGGRLGDPPLEIDGDRTRVLRKVLADLDGDQRRELTAGLRELRALVTNPSRRRAQVRRPGRPRARGPRSASSRGRRAARRLRERHAEPAGSCAPTYVPDCT